MLTSHGDFITRGGKCRDVIRKNAKARLKETAAGDLLSELDEGISPLLRADN